jgi:hypothetical protein
MNTQIKTETANANEAVNTVFQMVTLALVGIFSLAQAVNFLSAAV